MRLLVAAGGTGGHLYPAIAVARAFQKLVPEAEVTFVGTQRGLESRIVPEAGFPLELVHASPLRGGSLLRKIKGLLALATGFVDALRLLRRLRPQVVMGVGAYVSGPIMATAALTRCPTLILEPNATPGLANRWLAPLVSEAAVAWEETVRYFGDKAVVTGNPVRKDVAEVSPLPSQGETMRLLVFGGSQGSRQLNHALVESLPHLQDVKNRLVITHQTGPAELDWVRSRYQAADFDARIEPYLDPMAKEYEGCDLVVSRAGATTCAELAAAGRGSLLVPLAIAGAHQEHNAAMMERAGAARWIRESELAPERLAAELRSILEAPDQRERMAQAARKLARPEAARLVADRLQRLGLGRKGVGS